MSSTHALLYNSGYNPDDAYISVGLMLQAKMIENTITVKTKVYDFLRGIEPYKYRLGGKNISLYYMHQMQNHGMIDP